MLVVRLPPPDARDRALRDLFVDHNMRYFRAMVLDQTAALQAALHTDKLSQRSMLHIVRNRAPLIARDQAWKLEGQAIEHWSVSAGSDEYYWVDRGDGKVREGHARLHRTLQRYSAPPDTGRKEGRNNPGQAVHCRCAAVPREAFELNH